MFIVKYTINILLYQYNLYIYTLTHTSGYLLIFLSKKIGYEYLRTLGTEIFLFNHSFQRGSVLSGSLAHLHKYTQNMVYLMPIRILESTSPLLHGFTWDSTIMGSSLGSPCDLNS